jgi:hypothetical protein|tara:strand:+ start:2420 stop:2668 length:249 start_codon:yes stop_codon:yes gene_type:complete
MSYANYSGGTNVILDEKFTNSVRSSVNGGLSSSITENTKPNASAIMVSVVAGAGVGIFLNKSPLLFGVIGGILGGLIVKIAK